MNTKSLLLLLSFFSCTSLALFGQNGSVDLNFNYYDTAVLHTGLGHDGQINKILRQPDGKLIVAGSFTHYNGKQINNVMRFLPDGMLDPLFQINQIYPSMSIKSIALQADGKIILGGDFYSQTQEHTGIKRLNPDGTIDNTFFDGSLDAQVNDLAIQPDGKIIAAGFFSIWEGEPAANIVRLGTDGHKDNSFTTAIGFAQTISDIELFNDGSILTISMTCNKILSDGTLDPNFTQGNTISLGFLHGEILPDNSIIIANNTYLGRLNPYGNIDNTFNFINPEPAGKINLLEILDNGKIMVGWAYYNSEANGKMYRFNSDFTIDPTFECTLMPGEMINSLVESGTGKVIIAGYFGTVNGVRKPIIAEMESDGTLSDNNFTVGITGVAVHAVVVQPDHKILSGGLFSSYGSVSTPYLTRTDQDGAPDLNFLAELGSGPDSTVHEIILDPAGKILIAGDFASVNNVSLPRIARLNNDGSVDLTFVPLTQINGSILSVNLQADGKILIAGNFTELNGNPQFYIARLLADGTIDPGFSPDLSAGAVAGKTALKIGELSSGKIFVAGNFSCCGSVLRLNADGTLDNGFNASLPDLISADFLEVENGKIIVGGTWVDQISNTHMLNRLNENGVLDSTFQFGILQPYNNELHCIKRISENKIFIGGKFMTDLDYHDRLALIINENGVVDTTFNAPLGWHSWTYLNFDLAVRDAALQEDGRIVVVGEFQMLGDILRNNIARLENYTHIFDTICGDETYLFGSQNLDAPGQYSMTFESSMASDSVVVLNLEKIIIDAGVVADTSLTANCTDCGYQWINCATNELIDGANAQTYTPVANGNYAVVLSFGTCTDTSGCFPITAFDSVVETVAEITLYPNPSSGEVNVAFPEVQSSISVTVTDNLGLVVFEAIYENTAEINLSLAVTAGFYQVKLVLPTEEMVLALVIE